MLMALMQRKPGAPARAPGFGRIAGLCVAGFLVASLAAANTINPFESAQESGTEPALDPSPVVQSLRQKDFAKALEGANQLIKSDPKNPVGHNMLGGVHVSRHDFAAARKDFETAVALQPGFTPALFNLAQLDIIEKDYPAARRRYEAIVAAEPANIGAMLGLSRVAFLTNNADDGVRWLERAKTADPAALAPRIVLARQRLAIGDVQAALTELNGARRIEPQNPEVLDLLGQVQLALGQNAEAIATIGQWIKVQPDSALAHARMAVALEATADLRGAEESAKKALALGPDNPEAMRVQATIELRNGHVAQALDWGRRLQKRTPQSPAGFVVEGDALAAQKKYQDAVVAYESALKIAPTSQVAIKLHQAQASVGAIDKADDRLVKWIKDNPQDSSARQYLAGEYARRGRTELATAQYEALLQRQPQHVIALNNLALIYVDQRNLRGLELAQNAYNLRPELPGIIDTYGWALVQFSNPGRGLELIRKAAKLAPDNPEIRIHLAGALARTGSKPEARAELEKVLSGKPAPPQRQAAETLLKSIQ